MSENKFTTGVSMYANVYGYLGRPLSRNPDDADVFVIGLPYDLGTTGRSGTRSGPVAIRRASAFLNWEEQRWPWDFSLNDRIRVADYGDLEFPTGNTEGFFAEIETHYGPLLAAGKTTLSFGGDHFVPLPLLRAHPEGPRPPARAHARAHGDAWRARAGPHPDHGTMFFHAAQQGLEEPARSVQVGLRTHNDETHGFNILDATWVHEHGVAATVARIQRLVGARQAYLTFDIDCLDPAFAPGTGTPACGGLSTAQAQGCAA